MQDQIRLMLLLKPPMPSVIRHAVRVRFGGNRRMMQVYQTFDVALRIVLGPLLHDHPPSEPATRLGLGQTIEGQAQHIRRQAATESWLGCRHTGSCFVNFVSEQVRFVPRGDLHQPFKHIAVIHRTGRGFVRV